MMPWQRQARNPLSQACSRGISGVKKIVLMLASVMEEINDQIGKERTRSGGVEIQFLAGWLQSKIYAVLLSYQSQNFLG
jgi:hypothetical protein